jgi:MEMO1 family protein
MTGTLDPDLHKPALRPPAVAGTFYPLEAAGLRAAVAQHMAECTAPAGTRRPKALIVPHAGYPYSGSVAGCAFRRLQETDGVVRRVVLLGPSHRVPLRGLALPSVTAFATPLGAIPIDEAGRRRLRELGLAGIADGPHAAEHSLEVQLPFLQCVLPGEFDLLPIAAGLAPPELVARALEAVWNGADTLVVISSDLSHYHTFEEARRIDATTTRAILEKRSDLADAQACGARCINGLMQVARRRGLTAELLDQRNSGDTAGDRSRVVGYGSYALYES